MAKETGDSGRQAIQEYAFGTSPLRVDREKGIIHGVKVCGLESLNHRTYTLESLTKGAPLYNSKPVFVDHGRRGEARSYRDKIGRLESVAPQATGLFGDLHGNRKHPLWEQLCDDAENAPRNVGLSHVCEATVERRDGKDVVTEIHRVESADLVAAAATTRGLFESEEITDPTLREFAEGTFSILSDIHSLVLDEGLDCETKRARLGERLASWQADIGTASPPKQEPKTMAIEWKDVTVEALRENRKDLYEVITGTDATSQVRAQLTEASAKLLAKDNELLAVSAKLASVEAKEAKQALELAIAEELKTSGLNLTDPKVISEVFMGQLRNTSDPTARKAIIEDRLSATRGNSGGAPPFVQMGGDRKTTIGPGLTAAETKARLGL